MHARLFLSLITIAWLAAACSSSTGGDTQQTKDPGDDPPLQKLFTASDYVHEPVPANRTKGADNYQPTTTPRTYGSNEFHYTGKDCLRCHTPGGKADLFAFTMAGTVYKDILGSEPLAGAEVVILDSKGKVISMTTNAAGNFMTQTEIADANPDPAKTERTYKTWVLGPDGKILPMVTMTSGSCNMHHTPLNRRGALWAGSWSAAPEAATAEHISHTKHVAPIFAAKCVPCHVPAPDREKKLAEPLKGLAAGAGYDYTAGFDLTQYDSIIDDEKVVDGVVTQAQVKTAPSSRPFLNLAHPEDSLILAKMLGDERSHGGGKIAANTSDQDYQTLLRWIEDKAPGPVHMD